MLRIVELNAETIEKITANLLLMQDAELDGADAAAAAQAAQAAYATAQARNRRLCAKALREAGSDPAGEYKLSDDRRSLVPVPKPQPPVEA